MAKLILVFQLLFLAAIEPSQSARTWARRLQETQTLVQFYSHETRSGNNPTSVRVAQDSNTDKSSTLFGAIFMADDPLTESPDPNSKLVGRAQGLYGSAGQTETSMITVMSYAFTDGTYSGSSINLLGKNSAQSQVREIPIVGGTGTFRSARGYAIARTYSQDSNTGDAVIGYNVTIFHD
ncbi:hypothetical protein K2173_010622 [Erythroxylum novogranatense]|uniref:Dirigent protein n=1 Tax=Erythroxylum novogranatense TaxID=1862640 RepID=A0AAV8TEJ4_9ROSI|nr:hypothetical protein K2173_010622 [Erythroxylum novogranatense]